MLTLEQLVDKIETVLNKNIKTIYGFATDANPPVCKYEITFGEGDNVRNSVINAEVTLLVISKTETSPKTAYLQLIKLLTKIKQALTDVGFHFVMFADAVEFDNKGNITDNPAKLLVFTHLIEF